MKRVHWHWTAGAEGIIDVEEDSYHEIINPDGTWSPGTFPIEANKPPLRPGRYAAHTLNANSDAIGIACDAMAGARERPLHWGSNPLTEAQIDAMLRRTAHWCKVYNIPVSRKTTLSHAEVERNLGIKQRNKWDIMVLPGMTRVDDPVVVGDELRRRLTAIMNKDPRNVINAKPSTPAWLAAIFAAIQQLFRKPNP